MSFVKNQFKNTVLALTLACPLVASQCTSELIKKGMAHLDGAAQPFKDKVLELSLYKHFGLDGLHGDWITDLNGKLAEFGYESDFEGSDGNSLSAAYPALQKKVPYIALGSLPTPIVKLDAISQKHGMQVYMKNDSVSGGVDEEGAPLYGGNKVRKLGFLLAQAKALGAKKVMFPGCVGSNYAVAGAVHARRLGLQPICMLKHQPPSYVVQHNLLMHQYYGSELHYSPNNDIRALNALTVWLEHYKKDGQVPYLTPTGGSNVYGTLGFVDAAFELAQQIKQGLVPKPTHIYVPTGSCATTAGILLGCKAAGIDAQIVAIAVEPDEDPSFAQNIQKLFNETNKFLHENDNSFPLLSYTDEDLRIDLDSTGPNYGVFTQEGVEAATDLEESEGVILEGTYTGKAFAGLLKDIQKLPSKNQQKPTVLFWNTYSGLKFTKQLKDRDYTKLPKCFHDYFQENNIQELARKR